jgi:hypothetical protein
MDIVAGAREFAVGKLARQTRKYTGEPYLIHLEAVVGNLQTNSIDEPLVLAAAGISRHPAMQRLRRNESHDRCIRSRRIATALTSLFILRRHRAL